MTNDTSKICVTDFATDMHVMLCIFTVVNFRIVTPSNVSENSGSIMTCIEQMNNQLSEDVYVDIRTTQIGSTAAGKQIHSLVHTLL